MSLYSSLTQVLAPFAAKINGLLTGWDGTRYNTPGEAVRQQIADLHVLIGDEPGRAISASAISYGDSDVETALDGVNGRLSDLNSSKAFAIGTKMLDTGNLFDATKATQGYYLNGTNGNPVADANYAYSDYIPIGGDGYLYSENNGNSAIYFYDSGKNLIAPANRAVKNFSSSDTWPQGTVYCRFNLNLSILNSIQFSSTKEEGYYISEKQIVKNEYTINVGATQAYTTIKSAIDYINQIADPDAVYNIILDEGIYNALDGYDLESEASTFMGVVLPNNTNIFGQRNPENTIIYVDGTDFPSNVSANEISTLNMYRNHIIKNVTIKSKNIRYAVHDDDSYRASNPISDAVQVFENVHFLNEAKTITGIASYCIGIGAKKGQHFIFRNCWFENQDSTYCSFLAHNGTTAEKPVVYDLEACKISNNGSYGLRFTTTAHNLLDVVNIVGCKSNKNIMLDKISGNTNTNTNTGFKFYGHGNSGMAFSVNGIVLNDYDTEMML